MDPNNNNSASYPVGGEPNADGGDHLKIGSVWFFQYLEKLEEQSFFSWI